MNSIESASAHGACDPPSEGSSWFAIQTYPRHEKSVASRLTLNGVKNYLPIMPRVRQWSDRRKKIELPLFPCYTFVRIIPSAEQRVQVLKVPGVIGFVGGARQGIPIPDGQVQDIQTLIVNKIALDPYPFVKVGQRVRILGGALDGIEGILVRRDGLRRLVISVDSFERAVSLCVEGIGVQAV
jgi:transcription antitermination factor NusG